MVEGVGDLLSSSLSSCVTLSKLLDQCVPQFPHFKVVCNTILTLFSLEGGCEIESKTFLEHAAGMGVWYSS